MNIFKWIKYKLYLLSKDKMFPSDTMKCFCPVTCSSAMTIISLQSNHVTGRLLADGAWKSNILLLLRCHHGCKSPLLCSPLSPGSRWVLSTNEKSSFGLDSQSQAFTLSGSLLGLVYSWCVLLLQALLMPRSPRLQDIWSKAKDRKQAWIAFPKKGHSTVYRYQQIQTKEFKFLIYFDDEQVLDKMELVKERFSAQCPKSHPTAWKSSPPNQETQRCISVPASNPQHWNGASSWCTNSSWTQLRKQVM